METIMLLVFMIAIPVIGYKIIKGLIKFTIETYFNTKTKYENNKEKP